MSDYSKNICELRPLYYDMRKHDKGQEQFQFAIANLTFEVIFLIDRTPFELLIGVRNTQLAFVLKVEIGFKVSPIPDFEFRTLRSMLNLSPGKLAFTSWSFLDRLAKHVPQN